MKHKVKPGEYRLLLVDGHNSHHTLAFLIYAREHNIIIICYPSHATHIYQGLDVVIFAVIKLYIGQERDEYYRKYKKPLEKANFLEIYTRAHIRALTSENVKAAFRATGVWPYNPNIVSIDMLAPSKESSSRSQLPVLVADPAVQVLANLFHTLAVINDKTKHTADSLENSDESDEEVHVNNERQDALLKAVDALSSTEIGHLVETTQTTHLHTIPTMPSQSNPRDNLPSIPANFVPASAREAMLLAALQEAQEQNTDLINRNTALRAANLLNETYCGNANAQLEAQAEKKKKKGKGVLAGNHARLLTGDEFTEALKEAEREKRKAEEAKKARGDALAEWEVAVAEWEKTEVERKRIKAKADADYKVVTAAWDEKKKRLGRSFKDPKPKKGTIPKKLRKPLQKDFLEGGNEVPQADVEVEQPTQESDSDEEEDDK